MQWRFERERYSAAVDGGVLRGLWPRGGGAALTDAVRPFGTVCYTLPDDELGVGPKPPMTPWKDRQAAWRSAVCDEAQGTVRAENEFASLRYTFCPERVHMRFERKGDASSQLGIDMPFHFLGKKGGDYRTQLILSTPWRSKDGALQYWYIGSPEGQPLLVVAHGAAAWKIDYSEYLGGHFFISLKWLLRLDRCYGDVPAGEAMELDIFFPDSFEDAQRLLCAHEALPVAYAQRYCTSAGEQLRVRLLGDATHCVLTKDDRHVATLAAENGCCTVTLPEPGVYELTPYSGDRAGLSCVLGALAPYEELLHSNILSLQEPYHCDRGLCEGGVWAQAAILHQRLLGHHAGTQERIDGQLSDILTGRIPHCSVPAQPVGRWPAYHMYESVRTQEAFFGVALFTEAYRTYGKPEYLAHAIGMAECLSRNYIEPSGRIISRPGLDSDETIDYTTVTAPVLALVNLMLVLSQEHDPRAERYAALAERIADYIVRRDLNFPTEGGTVTLTEDEMEDGSISCSALSVLYVAYWVKNKPGYVPFAQKILRLHDSWCMKSPDVRMYGSSLRWWETLWEGDKDGPAICAGHAWSVWRAEADFYLGLLTNDPEAFLRSYNGFATNLIKVRPDGRSYACYHPDVIPGGGFHDSADEVDIRLKGGYPQTPDQSLSKYLWVRLEKTWYNTCVVYEHDGELCVLNAALAGTDGEHLLLRRTVTPLERIINLTDKTVTCTDGI